jgi:hypothetical protein
MTDWWDLPGGSPASEPVDATPVPDVATGSRSVAGQLRTCAWCATPAGESDARCSSCGAALAQRESIGDLVIPGLTSVDPALHDYASRPLQLRGASPSQGLASGAIVAAAAGVPVGIAALGGIAAVAAVEYIGAGSGLRGSTANVGEASEVVRLAIQKLDRGEILPTAQDETPRPELTGPREVDAKGAEEHDGA